jgi:imidazolonepropionase-like amidohydrolase
MRRNAILLLIGLSAPWLHARQRDVVKAFAVRDVRLFDGEQVSEHRTVLVQDGIIRRLGGADRRSIRSGLRADLVLVEGNPTVDILATRNIVGVWKRGRQVRREEFR